MDEFERYNYGELRHNSNIRAQECSYCGDYPMEGYFVNDRFHCNDCVRDTITREDKAMIAYMLEVDVSEIDVEQMSLESLADILNWDKWEY